MFILPSQQTFYNVGWALVIIANVVAVICFLLWRQERGLRQKPWHIRLDAVSKYIEKSGKFWFIGTMIGLSLVALAVSGLGLIAGETLRTWLPMNFWVTLLSFFLVPKLMLLRHGLRTIKTELTKVDFVKLEAEIQKEQKQHSFSTRVFGLFIFLLLIGIGVGIAYWSPIIYIHCERVEPTQVDCSVQKRFWGVIPIQTDQIHNLQRVSSTDHVRVTERRRNEKSDNYDYETSIMLEGSDEVKHVYLVEAEFGGSFARAAERITTMLKTPSQMEVIAWRGPELLSAVSAAFLGLPLFMIIAQIVFQFLKMRQGRADRRVVVLG